MMEAHDKGVGLVCVTHKELAELKRDQLLSKGLTASIEAA
jgi:ATP-dependent Clp protease adapter protein ClpS